MVVRVCACVRVCVFARLSVRALSVCARACSPPLWSSSSATVASSRIVGVCVGLEVRALDRTCESLCAGAGLIEPSASDFFALVAALAGLSGWYAGQSIEIEGSMILS